MTLKSVTADVHYLCGSWAACCCTCTLSTAVCRRTCHSNLSQTDTLTCQLARGPAIPHPLGSVGLI